MKTVTLIPEQKHYRVKETGDLCSLPIIANQVCVIENYSVGIGHSAHPNIDQSGSVEGMKNLGYWHKTDLIIKARGFYYNMSLIATSCLLDELCHAIEKGTYTRIKNSKNEIIYSF